MNQIKIIKYSKQYLNALTTLEKSCFLPENRASKELIDHRHQIFDQGTFLAFVNDQLVGYRSVAPLREEKKPLLATELTISHQLVDRAFKSDTAIYISQGILPEFRGREILTYSGRSYKLFHLLNGAAVGFLQSQQVQYAYILVEAENLFKWIEKMGGELVKKGKIKQIDYQLHHVSLENQVLQRYKSIYHEYRKLIEMHEKLNSGN